MSGQLGTADRLVELLEAVRHGDRRALARLISVVEKSPADAGVIDKSLGRSAGTALICGLTGPPGVGKSTLVGRLARECINASLVPGVLAVDPSSPITGGATLGDRVRMGSTEEEAGYFIRSIASRGHPGGLASVVPIAIKLLEAFGVDVVLVETVGTGQSDTAVAAYVDVTIAVTGPAMGDEIQAAKAGLLEVADIVVVNKSDLPGVGRTLSALRSTLGLYSEDPPTVVSVSAREGEGVAELFETARGVSRALSEEGRRRRRREAVAAAVGEVVRSGVSSGMLTADGSVEAAVDGDQPISSVVDWFLTRLA